MAFHGDLSSFPLPELLQWLDTMRKSGSLTVSWDAGERKVFLESGQLVATSSKGLWERIARVLSLSQIAQGEEILRAFKEARRTNDVESAFEAREINPKLATELAREELCGGIADLVSAQIGEFHWTEDPDRGGDEWVLLQQRVNALLFEALRWVDEQPEVGRALPNESINVRALKLPTPDLSLVNQIILALTQGGINLGKLRLALGISRLATNRRVYDLLRQGMVEVEGVDQVEADPVAEMLEKGTVLVSEGQFEAAGMIFSALLSSDPADRRVREFVRMVEQEHVAALYRQMAPIVVPRLIQDPSSLAQVRPEERHVASLVNGTWDVATIVLASQHRELETLKALSKLSRIGLIALDGE